jgi:hypothetical protein
MRPHNRGIDGMFLVGRRSQTRQRFEGCESYKRWIGYNSIFPTNAPTHQSQ